MPFLIHLFQEPITVDRIEGEYAIIEWENLSLSSLPIEIFPAPPREGDQFFITAQLSPRGSCELKQDDPVILLCPEQILYLPIEIGWRISQKKPVSINFSVSL